MQNYVNYRRTIKDLTGSYKERVQILLRQADMEMDIYRHTYIYTDRLTDEHTYRETNGNNKENIRHVMAIRPLKSYLTPLKPLPFFFCKQLSCLARRLSFANKTKQLLSNSQAEPESC